MGFVDIPIVVFTITKKRHDNIDNKINIHHVIVIVTEIVNEIVIVIVNVNEVHIMEVDRVIILVHLHLNHHRQVDIHHHVIVIEPIN